MFLPKYRRFSFTRDSPSRYPILTTVLQNARAQQPPDVHELGSPRAYSAPEENEPIVYPRIPGFYSAAAERNPVEHPGKGYTVILSA